jgi:hypothetical protein
MRILLILLLAGPLQAQVTITTNWVLVTNWTHRTDLRVVGGKVMSPTVAPWKTVTIPRSPGPYADARLHHDTFAQRQGNDRPSAGQNPHVVSFHDNHIPIYVIVSNVPLTSVQVRNQELLNNLSVRAFPIREETNWGGFQITLIRNVYDYGLPFTGLAPVVTKKRVLITNNVAIP